MAGEEHYESDVSGEIGTARPLFAEILPRPVFDDDPLSARVERQVVLSKKTPRSLRPIS